ncbi:MAG: ribosomal protein S18-alanine N-acetyltransferase [Lachnospiraceae bacterium]|jgi:ribosomal-protein-alanine N-acetyltransferase|nr:ribosomal protein S18-alanine N-acetyltransferase [Lachnospiraceae bacterium]
MNFEISEMTESDFNTIADSLATDFDDFWSKDSLQNELANERSKCIVARRNSEVVGFASIWFGVDEVHLTNIVTKKSFRHLGIGKLLLEKLIDIVKTSGYKTFTLEVNEQNEVALDFYKKYEFKCVGRRKKYYNGVDDAIIMTMEIS